MKTLRIVITIVFLIITLAYTVVSVTPTIAGPSQPDIECWGFVCFEADSCLFYDPLNPYYACTEWCYAGYWRCYGESACIAFC